MFSYPNHDVWRITIDDSVTDSAHCKKKRDDMIEIHIVAKNNVDNEILIRQ